MNARSSESLLASLSWLSGARAGAVCMNLIATSRLAHALGAENFGIFNFAISYVSYFVIVMNLGYSTLLTREIGYNPAKLRDLVESAFATRLLLAIVMAAMLLASLFTLGLPSVGETAVMIQGITLFSGAVGLSSAYQGLHRMRVVALRELMCSLINLAGILWLVRTPQDVLFAVAFSAGTLILTNALLILQYSLEFGVPRLRVPVKEDFQHARRSMPYFWSMLFASITQNAHIVLLGVMRSPIEVGLFASGFRLFNFAIVLPNLISTLFLPRIARFTTHLYERGRYSELCMQTIITCAVPIAIIGEALIPQILIVLFGPAYLAAARITALLLLDGLVASLNAGFSTQLLAVGRQDVLLRVAASGAAIGVALNLALIPPFGIGGAALGTLVGEIVTLAMFIWNRPEVPIQRILDFGCRCLLSALPAAILAHFVAPIAPSNSSQVILGGAVGIAAYMLVLRLLRIDLVDFATTLRRLG